MKSSKSKKKPARKGDWNRIAEETRQRCNLLTDEERERYELQALKIIYGSNAKAPTRSH